MSMRIDEMTEDQVLERVARSIPGYLSGLREYHRDFDPAKCVEAQVFELKELYKESRGLGPYGTFTIRDLHKLDALIGHFTPLMQEQARVAGQAYRKEQIVWMINGSTAQALLVPAFEQAGLTAEVTLQRYRAKVTVGLGGRSVRFYVGFKAMAREGTVEDLVKAVLDLKDALCRIGGDIKISR